MTSDKVYLLIEYDENCVSEIKVFHNKEIAVAEAKKLGEAAHIQGKGVSPYWWDVEERHFSD